MSKMLIAIGGNAIIQEGQKGTIAEQKANIEQSCAPIVDLIEQGHQVVVTHGNGPQVGNSIVKARMSSDVLPMFPLDVYGAESQGNLGYLIQQTITNMLASRGLDKKAVSLVTQVQVSEDDPAFNQPTKPIGPFYTKEMLDKAFAEGESFPYVEDSGRGYRHVVPSPIPSQIIEKDAIEALLSKNLTVVTVGGGGIPVVNHDGQLKGVEAVVDKDFASALLAAEIGADYLFILTGVAQVAVNFGKPDQRNLDKMTLDEAVGYLNEGQFPKGSMGPKIEAAILFLKNGGKNVIITSIDKLTDALEGKSGTLIVPNADSMNHKLA
ncbi:carbamate kinase [Fontibacillus phaseoli]|uniref:Carbamate kinase n=1 Tax=Fontibacillus phaseoli TaxID=1416533 RepID=A0A369AZ17_9BACL|nr:carbamate kinase [Fontibacillus phaseoli]RCX14403.1 carbamate kinase [Fontibacillus phaseoli]